MKKICIFMHGFDGGGAEKMTVLLANALHKLGHKVVFCVRYDQGENRYLLDNEIPVWDMKLSELSKIKKNLKNVRILREILRKNEFDVMLSITSEMSQVAAMATWFNKRRMPLIGVIHNTLSQEVHSFQKIREIMFPVVHRRMDAMIAVSEAVRKDYIQLCNANTNTVFTVYNPVVFDKIFQMAKEETNHPWLVKNRKWKTLILAARLSYQKNHILMLRSLKLLLKNGDYRLILLGIGELQEELKEFCRENGLQEHVDFYGYVNNPYAFYANADGVVLSSRFEGLPTVLIEALACGSKIISVDCPSGPREILCDGKYGTLVSMNDAAALADGIRDAMGQEVDRNALRKRAMDFSVENSVNGYLKVMEYVERKVPEQRKKKE